VGSGDRHATSDGHGKGLELGAGTHLPAFDPMMLFHRPVPIKTAAEVVMQPTPAPRSCPANPEYEALIDAAARNIYEPKTLGDVNTLKHIHDCDIASRDDVYKFVDLSLSISGDRYGHAMQPAEARQFEKVTNGGYTGIGLEIIPAQKAGVPNAPATTLVQRPVPGRSAEKADFQPGDAILTVDGKDVHRLPPEDIADLITAGKPGSHVEIVVDRHGEKLKKDVTREAIVAPPVVHDSDLGDGIAYIKIDNFANSTEAQQLEAAMDRHKDAKAFVVDVRDNPGGLVDQSIKSAELFVKSGVLMTFRSRVDSSPDRPAYNDVTFKLNETGRQQISVESASGKSSVTNFQRLPNKAGERPVVVLTNEKSASAAEIFTGAVHDSGHDTTIGTTTFGKGIGQNIIKNIAGGGYLKVTSLRYMTPSGQWPGDADTHKYGLKADIPVQNAPGTAFGSAADAQLNTAVANLKSRLELARRPGP